MTDEEAKKIAEDHDIHCESYWKVGHVINAFFEKYCEETIVDPTFVYVSEYTTDFVNTFHITNN